MYGVAHRISRNGVVKRRVVALVVHWRSPLVNGSEGLL